ncbi:7-cyano-7-deazaguanine/7-aminomethyl-7-deazaguanine transporter [Legionella sp. km772]|uniref:7-cyano-7-deazaguanine/7-aminomethyl-7- deazaguanine transporter n=1 Tax=Legionella sp. km772 TaxID=2498111 RepID=UPI000F8E55EF|nr:7-cyano-7-deazaguanine/7-aminomethyl-7-deazaguanine transporter [Legionella sp. km772]RUR07963.1 7-cyano-7-deazaguanine/7-aminomethyl-7-deazaguanine transporter [Legionella sp. km772]
MVEHNSSSLIIKLLTSSHILLLTLSNILVQYPFELFGFHTTWGAFSYPAIFILTDLTVRLSTSRNARRIIFRSMFPALFLSYFIASYLETAGNLELFSVHLMPLRIALACFLAYVVGQILDIAVFQRYRANSSWWLAPILSSTAGNLVDTFLFFAVAFYHCPNPFLSEHWLEIASIDLLFKIAISWLAFIPVYGLVLNLIKTKITLSLPSESS